VKAEVRRPLYQGSQMVAGLWFDCALIGDAHARERVLQEWRHGSRAYRIHGGYLLHWPQPRRLHCARLAGLALCMEHGVLSSAPLLDEERARIAPGCAALVRGASLHPCELGPATRVDPSEWLDVSDIACLVPLAPPSARGFVETIAPPAGDVRAVLGGALPPPSEQRARFLRAAGERAQGGGSAIGALVGGLAGLIALLPSRARSHRTPGRDGPGLLARLAMFTRVSRLLGWRQSRYLREMLRHFESGNLDEALRHAIPLDSKRPSGRMALGTPGRRARLEIGGAGSATEIGLADEDVDFLRRTYQKSFEALDRAGRVDEAVFVLAELLNRHTEAVDYLERKGRLAQAAQLAETLELTPALIVRLHCMAGNARRALLLARLMNAYGETVAELERRQHPAAPDLRRIWAHELAARGSMVDAARVLWPLKNERAQALAWLHAAEQAGGGLGIEGLLYKLALDEAAPQSSRAAVEQLLYAAGPEAARQRALACAMLLKLEGLNPLLRRMAAQLWRAALADRTVPREQMDKLLALSKDRTLAADAPKGKLPLKDPVALDKRAGTLTLSFAERGLLRITDARVLPDGGLLVALGEEGVALLRPDGGARARFPVPAHQLVLAEHGQAALALGRRERALRVSRIDLARRKAGDWFSAPLSFWADEYDGAGWSVVAEERLMVLDTTAPERSVLWQVGDLPGKIIGFQRHDVVEAVLIDDALGVEQWRYALPARRLMGREETRDPGAGVQWLPDPRGAQAATVVVEEGDIGYSLRLRCAGSVKDALVSLPTATSRPQVRLVGSSFLLTFASAEAWHCQLVAVHGRVLADIALPGAQVPGAALHGGHLCAWDQHGRLVTVELATSTVRTLALH
jgi:hypothetical protein